MLRLDDRVDGRPLALARIGIGLAGLLNVGESWVVLMMVDAPGALAMPAMDGLPAATGTTGAVLASLGASAAVCVTLGLGTRIAALVLAATLGSMMLLEQQVYSNHVALSMWCALWLVLSRSDARWSLRARIEGPGEVLVADQLLLMTQVSVVYAFTGLLKINPEFLSGAVIQENSRLPLSDPLAQAMAVAAVLTEVSLCVGLWFRRTRLWVACAGVGLHAAIPLVMYQPLPLVSFSISVVCLYPLFFASVMHGRSGDVGHRVGADRAASVTA